MFRALSYRSALLAAATALSTLATSSLASAALQPVDTLSPNGQSASYPVPTTGAAGDAAVSWGAYTDGLQISLRPAGGSWDASPTQLSTAGTQVGSQDVVIDADGAATAVWGEYTMNSSGGMPMPGPVTIFTARRPAGGGWGASEQLSTNAVNAGYSTALAVGPDGGVVALWAEGGSLRSATRGATGSWSASTAVPSSSFTQTPQLLIDADGTATAAWQNSSTNHIFSSTLPAGGSWTTPVDVSNAGGYVPRLAMTDDGDATLVWNGNMKEISARRSTTGGAWGAPVQISIDGDLNYYSPVVGVDAAGRATAAWSQAVSVGGSTQYQQKVATRDANGAWASPITLGVGTSSTPSVSAGADNASVAWRGFDAGNQLVAQSASRVAGGAWSSVTDLTDLGNAEPAVSVDPQGNVLLAAAPSSRVKVLGDDTSGPQLRSLSIPATTPAQATVNFSVSPLDVWSALGTTTWNFGDGATATGAAVSHQFAAEGAKTVTVTAADALNQTTTRTGTITVTAAAAPTPTPTPTPVPPTETPTPVPPAPTDTSTPSTPVTPSRCVSRRVIDLHFKLPAGRSVRTVTLEVTGQRTRQLGRTAREATIDLRGITRPTVSVTITAKLKSGKLITDTRKYKTCGR